MGLRVVNTTTGTFTAPLCEVAPLRCGQELSAGQPLSRMAVSVIREMAMTATVYAPNSASAGSRGMIG
jgi:hypothetical protein